ncbi:Wzz/FepE/Etk N-terminal domain-containing protein [Rhizobium sp.]|uniref:Wzz/FepE/Etk N-terminal domain-containing protein n=1 Tax=Rhizobium sp. TaxID=391 RepID=UPI0028B0E97B
MNAIDLNFYLSFLILRWSHVLIIICLYAATLIVVALLMPHQFQSMATILVEAPQNPSEVARSAVPTSAQQQQIVQQQITTLQNLVELADKLDSHGGERAQLAADKLVREMQSRINFLESPLSRGGMGGATLISVFFDAETPALAAKGANEVVSLRKVVWRDADSFAVAA